MTREQAINYLISSGFSEEQVNTIAKAFEPTTKNDLPHCQYTDEEIAKSFIEDVEAVKDQLPTKNDLGVDCISRAEAKAAIRDKFKDLPSRVEINTILNELPSVTPQERTGHWVGHWIPTYGNVECSVCGSVKDSRNVGKATHYCDFCGAKMESEENNG